MLDFEIFTYMPCWGLSGQRILAYKANAFHRVPHDRLVAGIQDNNYALNIKVDHPGMYTLHSDPGNWPCCMEDGEPAFACGLSLQ
jgi:hypothetical protein